jgi:hypothetical protein
MLGKPLPNAYESVTNRLKRVAIAPQNDADEPPNRLHNATPAA